MVLSHGIKVCRYEATMQKNRSNQRDNDRQDRFCTHY